MKVIETNLLDAYVIKCDVYEDSRGSFIESFNLKKFKEEVSSHEDFVQDNHSISKKDVLRGLHYQIEHPQGKLVRCTSGRVLDVLVDLRKSSPTFGEHTKILLDEKYKQVWVPPGFAHGFYVLSDKADVIYKITDYYYPQHERTLLWNDSELSIDWKIEGEPIVSKKDKIGKTFDECEKYD
jgi:dTDP-4-dehydrorhamnose 3,5-epimerase